MIRAPLIVVCLLVSTGALALAQTNDVRLENGSTEERLSTLVEVLRIPPETRSASALDAIGREAVRMLRYYRTPGQHDEAQQDLNSAYAAGLVRALGESRSKKFLPVVVEFAGFGKMARDALVNFGDEAIPALIEAATGPENDLHQKSGATLALADLCHVSKAGAANTISDDSRERCRRAAVGLLHSRLDYGQLLSACILALAVGRTDLRPEVELLATSSQAWSDRGLTNAEVIRANQNMLRIQLKIYDP